MFRTASSPYEVRIFPFKYHLQSQSSVRDVPTDRKIPCLWLYVNGMYFEGVKKQYF